VSRRGLFFTVIVISLPRILLIIALLKELMEIGFVLID